jgi:hypothetical protein
MDAYARASWPWIPQIAKRGDSFHDRRTQSSRPRFPSGALLPHLPEVLRLRSGGKQGDFLRTLLEHGAPMSAPQLKVATHSGSSTVSETLRKLQDLGLLDKNGSMYSLKKL